MTKRQTSIEEGNKAAVKASIALSIFVAFVVAIFLSDSGAVYPWLKALHIIAVISWMAGMLYLPRLFIYHTDAEPGSIQAETFSVMETRLLKVIMNPAMIIAWVLGLYLAFEYHGFSGGWLHAKLACVLLLSGVHGYFSRSVKRFAAGIIDKPARHWRMVNEVPTVLMILIVIFAVVKPF